MTEPRKADSLSREQLYELVWTTPIQRLAKRFGLSDVGLAKVCRKYNIPRPPRGYWQQMDFGKAPARSPLLPADGEKADAPINFVGDPDAPDYGGELQEVYLRAWTLPPIAVPAAGRRKPVIKNPDGGAQFSYIDVPDADRPRARRIMDALFLAVEDVGGEIIVEDGSTVIYFAGDRATAIRLRASYSEGDRLPSLTNPKKKCSKLILDQGRGWRDRKFHCWDGVTRRLEHKLKPILLRLIGFAGRRKVERLRIEESHRVDEIRYAKEAELERQRQELKARQDEERNRVQELLKEADSWRRSQLIREYVAAVRVWLEKETGGPVPKGSDEDRWLNWATMQADRMDPLAKSPPSVLDEQI